MFRGRDEIVKVRGRDEKFRGRDEKLRGRDIFVEETKLNR